MKVYYKVFEYNAEQVVDGDVLDAALIDGKALLGFSDVVFLGLDKDQLCREGSKIWKLKHDEIAKLITPLPKTVNADSGLAITFHTEQTYCNVDTQPAGDHYVFIPVLCERLLKLAEESQRCEAVIGVVEEGCPRNRQGVLSYLKQHQSQPL